jgi:hypothetical protein
MDGSESDHPNPKGPLPDPESYESESWGPNLARPGLVAIGTVIEPVPVTGFEPNFSPSPRIAPPPLGRDIEGTRLGADAATLRRRRRHSVAIRPTFTCCPVRTLSALVVTRHAHILHPAAHLETPQAGLSLSRGDRSEAFAVTAYRRRTTRTMKDQRLHRVIPRANVLNVHRAVVLALWSWW